MIYHELVIEGLKVKIGINPIVVTGKGEHCFGAKAVWWTGKFWAELFKAPFTSFVDPLQDCIERATRLLTSDIRFVYPALPWD